MYMPVHIELSVAVISNFCMILVIMITLNIRCKYDWTVNDTALLIWMNYTYHVRDMTLEKWGPLNSGLNNSVVYSLMHLKLI